MDAELIQHSHDDVIHQLLDRPRVIVKRRHRWKNHRAHARELQHVLQMDVVQRRFAHHQYQLAALLENHIRGTMHQVLALAACDRPQSPHAARCDDHARRQERTAGHRRALVARRIRIRRHLPHAIERVRGLLRQRVSAPFADDQMRFHAGSLQRFQQPDPENCPGGAGDADH